MSFYNTKTVKLLLLNIFFLAVGVSSHASETVIYYGDAAIAGKEYLFTGCASENKDTLQAQNPKTEMPSSDNPYIFIAKNTKIYGKEHLYKKQNTSQKIAKAAPKAKSKTFEPVKNELTEKKPPKEIVVPDFPFDPSSLSYSYICKESAVPVSQQRHHDYPAISKGKQVNTHSGVENSSLSLYIPEQRRKFSTASTQYGILTLISPNSPPLL